MDEFKRIYDGFMYHVLDLLDYLDKHGEDEIFQTDEGRSMKKHLIGMCMEHALVGTICVMMKTKDELKNDDKSMEDALKDAFNRKDEE